MRKLSDQEKVPSLYDPYLRVIKSGKANREIECGNNLWRGEICEGFIADYLLEKEKTRDAMNFESNIAQLTEEQRYLLRLASEWCE